MVLEVQAYCVYCNTVIVIEKLCLLGCRFIDELIKACASEDVDDTALADNGLLNMDADSSEVNFCDIELPAHPHGVFGPPVVLGDIHCERMVI